MARACPLPLGPLRDRVFAGASDTIRAVRESATAWEVAAVRKRTWGFSDEEWARAGADLSALLAEVAESRSTITYGEIARRVFHGRVSARSSALMDLLGEVDSATDAERGIMIASLVVRADTGMPGEGYFAFAAEELGREALDDPRGFWEHEVERVWDAYSPADDEVHA